MATLKGGMEFRAGRPVRVPAVPETLPAHLMRLNCPERPEVVTGQVVRQCQILLEPAKPGRSCHVSPVTGTVRDIRQIEPTADGAAPGFEVTIEPSLQSVPVALSVAPPSTRKLDQWVAVMRQVGPWADKDGGIGIMPQLEAARMQAPDSVICIGLDAFPPYPVRSSLLLSFTEEAVQGTIILAELVGAKNVTILTSKHGPAVSRLRAASRKVNVQIKAVPNIFPSADPTLVAWHHARERRRLPHGGNPASCGLLMFGPWTAIRVARWVAQGKLDIARPMMVAWPEAGVPMSPVYALAGQPLSTLDSKLATLLAGHEGTTIVFGNPMNGRAFLRAAPSAASENAAKTQAVSGSNQPAPVPLATAHEIVPTVPDDELLVTVLPPVAPMKPEGCISCGWCAEVCPTSLRPVHLMDLARKGQNDHVLAENLDWCIDCGLCSHVCPVSLPLAQTLRHAKAALKRN